MEEKKMRKKNPTSICKSTHTNIFEQQNKPELQNTMCVIIIIIILVNNNNSVLYI